MKKEYINPEIEVVKLNTMPLLAGSGLDGGTPGNSYTSTDVTYSSEFQDNGDSNESW